MKPTEFLNEGNQHCPKCDCNTVTTDGGKCKLCGTKKLEEEQVVEQQMRDVAAIFIEAKKQGDKETMLAAQQKLTELNEVKHFRTTYGWAGGRNEKTGGVHKHPGNKEYTVYCSQCGGEFRRGNKNGFSHCKDHDGMHNYDLDEEGGRWEYDRSGKPYEVTPQQAAAHAKANLERMSKQKKDNPFEKDDEDLNEVKSGEIANHPWVCRRAKIKGTGEVGEVIRVCREHTFSQMVPFVTMVWIKLDSGETKEVRQNHVQIAKKTAGLDEDTSSSCIATALSGKTGPSGPAGSLFGGPQKRVQESDTPSNTYGVKDKKGYNVYTGTKEGAQNYVKKNPGKGLKVTNIKKAGSKKVTEAAGAWRDESPKRFAQEILEYVRDEFGGQAWFKGGSYAYKVDSSKPNQLVASDGSVIECKNIAQALAEYCDSGVFNDFADCDQSYWSEFFRPVKNKTPMARDGAPMYGNEQERNELANMRGESKSNVLKGITLAEGQLNEYKPKIIPKTLAGGKLNPNHPGNAAAIANEKEAKYKRQERAKQERTARTARANERKRREAQKEKARTKGQKAKAALGSANPTNPLEEKAKNAMMDVWQAIAPDMMQAISGSHDGYSEDEDLLEDPYWVAEVCCDANHMQTFAHLSPEEEREILDNLDQKTLARLASDFGI
jgi:hypothetical protein